MLDTIALEGKSVRFIMIVVILVLAFVASAITKTVTKSKILDDIENTNTHIKTYSSVMKGLIDAAIVIVAVYLILRVLGIDVNGMIAGVGITAIVIGFALQDLLKDIITALSIMYANTFDIGDQVGIGKYRGQIVDFTLRRTTIHDTNINIDIVLNNREITSVEKLRAYFSYTLPIPNDKTPEECLAITEDINALIETVDYVYSSACRGLQYFTDETVVYKYNITCDMLVNSQIKRDINKLVFEYYNEHGMKVIDKEIRVHH